MVLQLINAAGLVSDISGVIIIFKYGLLGELQKAVLETDPSIKKESPEKLKEMKRNVNTPRIGLYFIIGGFCLQFACSIIQAFT